jgi:hypothetical protein
VLIKLVSIVGDPLVANVAARGDPNGVVVDGGPDGAFDADGRVVGRVVFGLVALCAGDGATDEALLVA